MGGGGLAVALSSQRYAVGNASVLFCHAGPRGGGALQRQTADQALGGNAAAFRRAGGAAAVPVQVAALQRERRGRVPTERSWCFLFPRTSFFGLGTTAEEREKPQRERSKTLPTLLSGNKSGHSAFPQVLIRIARAEAVAARQSTIVICVLRTEEDLSVHENAISSLEADKESVVTFGPWKAGPAVRDLLDCIKMDIEKQGYTLSIQPHPMEKSFLSKSYDFFYRVIFTWW